LALARYEEVKKEYNFVSFEESNKAKEYLSGKVEAYCLPINDFNEEMYSFRKNGFAANPDTTTKGLLFAPTYSHLKNLSEFEGEVITPNHKEFLTNVYDKTTAKHKK
jgi:hypothetical protein